MVSQVPLSSGSTMPQEEQKAFTSLLNKDRLLLLGVTGGIASGKSTVADMLAHLGAFTIDFDALARTVVEPEKPAWKEIIGHFGHEVLQEDGQLDRKKLGHIVFQDEKERKKLESLTHPRILEEYQARVNAVVEKDPDAIIQVVIPLLFEVQLEALVHKILVVYIPPAEQINRLIKRDGISRDEAARILKAQLPLDEKVKNADFVIHNNGPLDQTRRQVDALWDTLKGLQKNPQRGGKK